MFISILTSISLFSGAPDPPRYNVLLLISDDLRPELGAYDNTTIVSPTIDSIARNGLVFNRVYCQMALCSPSRSSMLTGLRPDVIRVYDLVTHFREAQPTVVTLPQAFRKNGYQAIGFGKVYHNGIQDPESWSSPWWYAGGPTWIDPENMSFQQSHGKGRPYESVDGPDNMYRDGKLCDKVVQSLEGLPADEPFFMAVGFEKPHLPYNAPKKYWDLYDEKTLRLTDIREPPIGMPLYGSSGYGELLSYYGVPSEGRISTELERTLVHGYYASISFFDAQVSKIIQKLRQLGKLETTIVVIIGDHGYKLGEYGMWAKSTNYEVDTRVPMIISTPEMAGKPMVTNALVELLDLYPTLADLAGIPVPEQVQGVSLVPLFSDPERQVKSAAFSQFIRADGEVMGYAVRTDSFRYVLWQNTATLKILAEELYDHRYDPSETFNLAGVRAYGKIIAQHRDYIETQTTIGFDTDIFPNPASRDFVTITLNGGPDNADYRFRVVLYDLAGKVILEQKLNAGSNIVYLDQVESSLPVVYQIFNQREVIARGRLIIK